MRISDWSSDVCSSDLPDQVVTERSRFGEDEVRPEDRAAARDVAVDRDGLTGEADVTVDSARDRDRLSRRDDVAGDGAADRDRLARSVDIAWATQEELDQYLHVLAEAEKRDHRRSEEHTSELQSLMRISYA